MADSKPIKYIDGMPLELGKKYVSECGIEFSYIEDKEKPYFALNVDDESVLVDWNEE